VGWSLAPAAGSAAVEGVLCCFVYSALIEGDENMKIENSKIKCISEDPVSLKCVGWSLALAAVSATVEGVLCCFVYSALKRDEN
jgi:hypothetical protein